MLVSIYVHVHTALDESMKRETNLEVQLTYAGPQERRQQVLEAMVVLQK